MSLSLFGWVLLFAVIGAFWWNSDQVKSLALHYAYQLCRKHELQLLDQTLVLKNVRLKRGSNDRLGLQRLYQFEFTTTGEQRYKGTLLIAGKILLSTELEPHIFPEPDTLSRRIH